MAGTVAAEVGGRALGFDVTDLAAVQAGFAEAGPVDVLVNNAGIPPTGSRRSTSRTRTPPCGGASST